MSASGKPFVAEVKEVFFHPSINQIVIAVQILNGEIQCGDRFSNYDCTVTAIERMACGGFVKPASSNPISFLALSGDDADCLRVGDVIHLA